MQEINKDESPWKKRFDRERKTRKSAEFLLEEKAIELFQASQELKEFNNSLEEKIKERTEDYEKLNNLLEERVKSEIIKRNEQEQLLIQQSKMSAMGEMVGSIAHQWRQPLNVVSLLTNDIFEAYEYGDLDDGYIKDVQKDISENINYMSETIDDFRNFFRISKNPEHFNLKSVIIDVLRLYFHQSKSNKLEINTDYNNFNNEDLTVIGFKNEFKQVVLNLINNAKDILNEKNIENKIINIELISFSESVIISIEDNGGGVPDNIIDKIFQPYFTTKHEGQGTGIGLYMSKTIIEKNMGGAINIINSDIGAKFVIELKK